MVEDKSEIDVDVARPPGSAGMCVIVADTANFGLFNFHSCSTYRVRTQADEPMSSYRITLK